MISGKLTHGTEWAYTVRKCHCDDCKTAHAAYERAYRQRRKARGWRLLHGKWIKT